MINTDRLCLGCMNDNGGEKVCKICGYDSSVQNDETALPLKSVIKNRFLVGKVLNINGEGITYIGWDNSSNTIVNIKEYFPSGFAKRNPDKTVSMIKGGEYTFNEGLMEFIEINKALSELETSAVLSVVDVFEENGTVYAVFESVSSITLREFLVKNGGALKWEQARPLFLPLIDAIKAMNDKGIIHRAISIDTIIVGRDSKLRITNYSIKKIRLSDSEMNGELYKGFASIEQYGFEDMHDDTYTDVYGLCATLFAVLIGSVPPEASQRINNDSMTIPSKFAEELPRHVLSALANGLQVLPQNRTQNIEEFKNQLVYGEIEDKTKVKQKKSEQVQKVEEETPKKKKSGGSAKYVIVSSACTAVVFLIIAAVLMGTVFKDTFFKKQSNSSSSEDLTASVPVVDEIGSVDSNAAESSKQYTVPKLIGKYYSETVDNEEYEKFVIEISGKEFSDSITKGQICKQSVQEGTNVDKGTTIHVTISLGPKTVKIANVTGLDETSAKLELLKQGFLYDNIEILEKYDEDKTPSTVLEQDPKYSTSVSNDTKVKIYINSYKGEEETSSQSSGN